MPRLPLSIALFALVLPAGAAAQVALPPTRDPSTINEAARRDQQRREAEALPRPSTDPLVTPPPPAAQVPASDASVTLRDIAFDRSAYLSHEELTALARPFIGKAIRIADLKALIERIDARYAARGIATARATLPPQRIGDGVLRIHLIEGRIGKVTVIGGSSATQARTRDRIVGPAGSLADTHALEAGILRYNRTRDSQLRAAIAAGAGEGETDLTLNVIEPKRIAIDLFGDTNGYDSTGNLEGGYTVRLYRLIDDGDRAAVSFLASAGVRSLSGSYGATLGDRVRIGIGYARGTTRVTGGALAAADVRGISDTVSVDASALGLSTPRLSLAAAFAGRYTASRVSVAGAQVGDTQTLTGGLSAVASWSIPGLSAQISQGVQYARDEERTTGLVRRLFLFQGNGAVTARGASPLFARLRGAWQISPKRDLGGTLQFFASGAGFARAFAPGELSGDQGVFASLEGGADRPTETGRFAASLFVDGARVSQGRARADGYSAGVALSGTIGQFGSVQAHVARPIGGTAFRHPVRGFLSIALGF